jgi:hypothetical protein
MHLSLERKQSLQHDRIVLVTRSQAAQQVSDSTYNVQNSETFGRALSPADERINWNPRTMEEMQWGVQHVRTRRGGTAR